MKAIVYILCSLLCFSFCIMVSCNDSAPFGGSDWKLSVQARYLGIEKTDVQFAAAENLTQILHVSSVSVGWKISEGEDWIAVSPNSGNADAEVKLTAKENLSGDDIRTCIINLCSTESDYKYSRPISITQSNAHPKINIDENMQTLRFSRDASTQSITVDANFHWEASCSESWIILSASEDKKSLDISVTENVTTMERRATIKLIGSTETSLMVIQEGILFNDIVSSLLFGNKSASRDVTIETDGRWKAETEQNWITLSLTSGIGSATFTVSVSDNANESERSGVVKVTVSGTEKQIIVTQLGTYFTVSAEAFDGIPSKGGMHAVNFTSSDSWSATSKSPWVTLSPSSGQNGQSVLNITFGENVSIQERYDTTYIKIDNDYLQDYRIITRQYGRYLWVSSNTIDLPMEQSTQTITVQTDGSYDVSVLDNVQWLTCTREGNDIKIYAKANEDPLSRTAKIKVSLTDVSKDEQAQSEQVIVVTQSGAGYSLNTNQSKLSIESDGMTTSIKVTSNDDWMASSNQSWIKLSLTAGRGDMIIQVTIDANTNPESREGFVSIKGEHCSEIVVDILQSGIGYYLMVDGETTQKNVTMDAVVSTKTFSLESNDSWNITLSKNWVSVNPSSGNGNNTISISCSANDEAVSRTCELTVRSTHGCELNFFLSQSGIGYHTEVSTQQLYFNSEESSNTFTITSNDSWTVSSANSWISLSLTKGTGNATIDVSVQKNTSTNSRTGIILVAGPNFLWNIWVEQEGVNYTHTVNGVSFTMIPVQGGTFQMGATSEQQDPESDEMPVHNVTLSDYCIGETEVTQELWMAVMGSNPSNLIGEKLPVVNVSWEDCQEFIQKLNQKTGKHFRLPTEAEWEFAARGGNKSNHTKYSGSSNIDEVAWYMDNSNLQMHQVKTKRANELCIYDMTGNVYEWCQDWYGSYSSNAQMNPIGPADGIYRVNRGGSWLKREYYCRSAERSHNGPTHGYSDLGLRLAL